MKVNELPISETSCGELFDIKGSGTSNTTIERWGSTTVLHNINIEDPLPETSHNEPLHGLGR